MPLLPQEPCLFPANLFDGPAHPTDSSSRWWALHTKPRAEKSLARHLLGRKHAFFLPIEQKRWSNRGRMHTAYLPLFPSYLFLHGPEETRMAALETNLVVNILPVADQEELWTDLMQVNRLLGSGAPLLPEEHLQAGAPVEITSGLFEGLRGKFRQRGDECRLVVEVQLLQRGVSVEIESWMIRFLEHQPPVVLTAQGQSQPFGQFS